MAFSFDELETLLKAKELPSYDLLFSLCDKAVSLLEEEDKSYRPAADNLLPGSLVEFSEKKPVIIIPDIHGRADFLLNILQSTPSFLSKTVFDSLADDEIFLVGVGDAIHTERQGKQRWLDALIDFDSGNYTGESMTLEMKDCLSVLASLMQLKLMFPRNFHFLKGNHENILNRNGEGDYAFRKYADEGNMTKSFITQYYGEDILYLLSLYEGSLPLVFANPSCVISHAEPRNFYSRAELINARQNPSIVEGLTWTRNGESEKGCVFQIIKDIFDHNKWNAENASYFAGHSPVEGNFELRQRGLLVQIHNPLRQNVAVAVCDRKFNPENDIIGVNV